MAIAETGAGALAVALGVIAQCDYPVVFHCAAGKDRTGILAGLLLSALGASDETIAQDYELTNLSLAAHLSWATVNDPEEAAEIAARPAWLRRSSGPVIKAFLESLRARHGSIDHYFDALGVSEETLDTLRARLLEP